MARSFRLMRASLALAPLALLLALASCADVSGEKPHLRLATTTSTRDTGILDALLPAFEREHGCTVDVVAVGTGAALALGRAGDVEALVVHAEDAELAFVADGHGVRREPLMVNSFALVGPPDDPAGVRGLAPAAALARIAHGEHPFVSRGDDSGTHRRELGLWAAAGGLASWDAYAESGQGMGATLTMASELGAYTLVDEGTLVAYAGRLELARLVEQHDSLRNPYGALVVDPARTGRSAALAHALVSHLVEPRTQAAIGAFRVGGRALFHPLRAGD